MEQRHGQLSGHTLRFPFPLPGRDAEMTARTKAATLDRETESTYEGWPCNKGKKTGSLCSDQTSGRNELSLSKGELFFAISKQVTGSNSVLYASHALSHLLHMRLYNKVDTTVILILPWRTRGPRRASHSSKLSQSSKWQGLVATKRPGSGVWNMMSPCHTTSRPEPRKESDQLPKM